MLWLTAWGRFSLTTELVAIYLPFFRFVVYCGAQEVAARSSAEATAASASFTESTKPTCRPNYLPTETTYLPIYLPFHL